MGRGERPARFVGGRWFSGGFGTFTCFQQVAYFYQGFLTAATFTPHVLPPKRKNRFAVRLSAHFEANQEDLDL